MNPIAAKAYSLAKAINNYIGNSQNRTKAVCVPVFLTYTVNQLKTAILRAKTRNGANLVHMSIEFNQAPTDNTMTANAQNAKLPELLDYCNEIGIDTCVRIHVQSPHHVNPSNKTTWFANYKAVVLDEAEKAVAKGVKYFSIENEMLIMTNPTYLANWQDIHDDVKAQFPSLTTLYSMSLTEYYAGCCLIGMTDINGINVYPQMTDLGLNETDQNLRAAWYGSFSNLDIVKALKELKESDKKLWVIETGCGSNTKALEDTASFPLWAEGTYSPETQEKFYKSLFEVLWRTTIDGMGLWSIGDAVAQQGYSYQYQPAEDIVDQYWGGAV